MANRTIQIVIKASNEASKDIESAEKSVGKFGSGLSSMLAVAGGNLVSSAISSMTGFFTSFASQAVTAVGNAQTLEIALEGLLTQSLMYEKVNEVRQTAIGLTEEETQKLSELQSKLVLQNAQLKEQEQRVWEMTNRWTDQGLATQTAKAKLDDMRISISGTEQDITKLVSKQNDLVTSTTSSWQETMNFADAQELAKVQTAELLKYVQELAVISPFETSTVEQVVRIGLAAGLSTEQVKNFTGAWLDYAATQGITSENLAFATDQFLQLRKTGKLTEIDLRQLRRLGIDVAKVLGVEMGMSVEEFNSQVSKSPELMDEMINSFVNFASKTTAGASKRMATTVTGMMSALKDIVEIGSRNLFRPIIEAVSPFAFELISTVAKFVTGDSIANIGKDFADSFMSTANSLVKKVKNLFAEFNTQGLFGKSGTDGNRGLLAALGLSPEIVLIAESAFNNVMAFVSRVQNIIAEFQSNGLFGKGAGTGSRGLLAALGLSEETVLLIQYYWQQIQALINGGIPAVIELLLSWKQQLTDALLSWLIQAYVNIPTILTTLVNSISTFIGTYPPMLIEAVKPLAESFWSWVNVAITRVGEFLGALFSAFVAWLSSAEAQSSLLELGQNIGKSIVKFVGLAFQNADDLGLVMTRLTTGLLTATGLVLTSLIAIGAQIVAGILSGILESFGIDLEPATFSELGNILKGIALNVVTIAKVVGQNIVDGFIQGIKDYQALLETSMTTLMQGAINAVTSYLGISSPSTVFFGFGINIVQGLIDGLMSMAGQLTTQATTLLGSLFGGEEQTTTLDVQPMIDSALLAIQTGIMPLDLAIQNIYLLTFPAFLAAASLTIMTFTLAIQNLQLLAILPLDLAIQNIYLLTLPTLMTSALVTTQSINVSILSIIPVLDSLILKIGETMTKFFTLGKTAITSGSDISSGMNSAVRALEKLSEILVRVIKRFADMEAHAKAAARAAREAGGASAASSGIGFSHGLGFAAGTPANTGGLLGLGFKIPPGYPNDSFGPLFVESGEEMLVTPKGTSIEDLIMSRLGGLVDIQTPSIRPAKETTNVNTSTNIYNFNQTVNTRAEQSTVIQDLQTMQALVG